MTERMSVLDAIGSIVDRAHDENLGGKHRAGFCEACADAHLVAQTAASVFVGEDWPSHRGSWARTV